MGVLQMGVFVASQTIFSWLAALTPPDRPAQVFPTTSKHYPQTTATTNCFNKSRTIASMHTYHHHRDCKHVPTTTTLPSTPANSHQCNDCACTTRPTPFSPKRNSRNTNSCTCSKKLMQVREKSDALQNPHYDRVKRGFWSKSATAAHFWCACTMQLQHMFAAAAALLLCCSCSTFLLQLQIFFAATAALLFGGKGFGARRRLPESAAK